MALPVFAARVALSRVEELQVMVVGRGLLLLELCWRIGLSPLWSVFSAPFDYWRRLGVLHVHQMMKVV